MRKLVLCEKPSVARDLARALGVPTQGNGAFASDSLIITWCIGHLVELEEPSAYVAAWRRWSWDGLPMIPGEFRLRPIKGTSRQWQVVREQLRRRDVSSVVNACDAGREGELIFRFCYELAGCKLPVERLWISSLTTQAIKRGFAELRPGRAYDALAAAARCRAESDWLVGLNATRAVTLWRGGQTLLSLGRVQTPTLAMLVTREREIQRFVPRDYFEVEAQLNADAGGAAPFVARFEHAGKRRFVAADLAEQVVARDRQAAAPWVESVEEKPVREPPPLLFDLGSLQRTCNRRFGWSAKETLSLAQSLYERHKLLTYPRTDSRYLSNDLVPLLGKTFAALGESADYSGFCATILDSKVGAPRRIFQDHKVTDHHAIIPTPVEHSPERLSALSSSERRLLDLVARRFLGAFFPDAEFRETKATLRVDATASAAAAQAPAAEPGKPPDDEYLLAVPAPPDRYLARGRVRVRAGWQEVAGFGEPAERSPKERAGARENEEEDENQDDDKEREKNQALPPLTVGMRLNSGKNGGFRVVAKQTRPPPRYTEASLLAGMEGAGKQLSDDALRRAMKDHGLGTPATRAAIIETLLERGYATRRAKLLVPTELGLELVGTLPMPGLSSPELTGKWEARLAQLAEGHGSGSAFMSDIAAYVRELIAAVRAAPVPPPLSASPPSSYRANPGAKAASPAAAAAGPRARFRKAAGQKSAGQKATKATSVARRAKTPRAAASADSPRRRASASPDQPAAAPAARRTRTRAASAEKTPKIPKPSKALKPTRARKKASAASAPPPTQERGRLAPPAGAWVPPPPGTPVEPPILCPRCGQGRMLWGRRAWGCANFRTCPLTIAYEQDGRSLSQADLRIVCHQAR